MKVKRRINYDVYTIALGIAVLFFISGIFVGDYFAYKKVESLDISQRAMSALLSLSELKGEIIQNETSVYCNLSWSDVWAEKVAAGQLLASLESKLGKTDPKIIEQKRIYNEVQFRTLKLVESIKENCNLNWTIIIFFYTNSKNSTMGNYNQCELQGSALDTLYDRNKDNIKIFSFDVDALDSLSQGLADYYNITRVPTLIINKAVFERFMSRNEITQIINK